jgi:hypothetical protein
VILAIPGDLNQLIDDMRGRRLIRVPHPEINNVFPSMPGIQLQSLNLCKHVRRKPFDAIKAFHIASTI